MRPIEFRAGEGTSYAAALVSAAAALLIAVRPDLAPDQVAALLERSAADMNAATGCRQCPLQRDQLSGWGRLDVSAALARSRARCRAADRFESNDDAGDRAFTLWGQKNAIARDGRLLGRPDRRLPRHSCARAVHLRCRCAGRRARTRTSCSGSRARSASRGSRAEVAEQARDAVGARRAARELLLPRARRRLVLRRGEDRDGRLGPLYAPLREEQVRGLVRFDTVLAAHPGIARGEVARGARGGRLRRDLDGGDAARSVPAARGRGDRDRACRRSARRSRRAFTRSPMVTAMAAWDLQAASGAGSCSASARR